MDPGPSRLKLVGRVKKSIHRLDDQRSSLDGMKQNMVAGGHDDQRAVLEAAGQMFLQKKDVPGREEVQTGDGADARVTFRREEPGRDRNIRLNGW